MSPDSCNFTSTENSPYFCTNPLPAQPSFLSSCFPDRSSKGAVLPQTSPDGSLSFQPPTPFFLALALKMIFASPCNVGSCGWAERGRDSARGWIHLGAQSEHFSWAHKISSCWLMHFNVKKHVLLFRWWIFFFTFTMPVLQWNLSRAHWCLSAGN